MPTLNQINVTNNDGSIVLNDPSNPIIEPIGGPVSIDVLMDRFPESVYSKGKDSHLYRFLTALAGDSGAGWLHRASMLARLKNEAALISFTDLDFFYGSILDFKRLPSEIYTYTPKDESLEKEVWDKIHAMDTSYRNRIVLFLQSTRFGNSPRGIELAAEAACGIDVEVVENYRWLFDSLSDDILGVERVGNTLLAEEFVVVPRAIDNRINQSQKITITITGTGLSGSWVLDYDGLAITVPYGSTAQQVSDILGFVLAGYVQFYDEIVDASGTITIVELASSASVISQKIVVTSPNANYYEIEINDSNINVYGIHNLSYTPSAGLTGTNANVAIGYPNNALFYVGNFSLPNQGYYDSLKLTGGAGAEVERTIGTTILIEPNIEQNIVKNVDKLRPVHSIVSVKTESERFVKVPVNKVVGSSEKINVTRFVTGKADVVFPAKSAADGTFITGAISVVDPATGLTSTVSVEDEITHMAYSARAVPIIYHTVQNVYSYTDQAKYDPLYTEPSSFYYGASPQFYKYRSIAVAPFGSYVKRRYPSLALAAKSGETFWDYYALARPDTPLIITTNPYINAN
jgi:hypothetical protein